MESESSPLSAIELCTEFAHQAELRESELGPTPNCPTAADLQRVVEIVEGIHIAGKVTAQQANAHLLELESISDKWLDPESDPIGVRLHPFLEEVIEGIHRSPESAFPESAEAFREKAKLRNLKKAMQRTIYLRSINRSWLGRIWTTLTRRSRSESL